MMGRCRTCDRLLKIELRKIPGQPLVRLVPVSHAKEGDDTGGEECPGTWRPL